MSDLKHSELVAEPEKRIYRKFTDFTDLKKKSVKIGKTLKYVRKVVKTHLKFFFDFTDLARARETRELAAATREARCGGALYYTCTFRSRCTHYKLIAKPCIYK